ncbi:hypothetical protein CPB85DRAFT_1443460 [Mucidula mucida]|nr:hypothetical protein CPB85DRAFT_1443460 [Mucidula mucida]
MIIILHDLSTLKHLIVLPDLLASLYFELNILPKTNLRGVNFAKPVYKVKRKAWLQQRHTPGINTPRIPADLDRVWMIWDIIQHGRGITQFFLPFPHSHLQALSDYDHDDLYGGHLLTVALRSPTARCVRHGLANFLMLLSAIAPTVFESLTGLVVNAPLDSSAVCSIWRNGRRALHGGIFQVTVLFPAMTAVVTMNPVLDLKFADSTEAVLVTRTSRTRQDCFLSRRLLLSSRLHLVGYHTCWLVIGADGKRMHVFTNRQEVTLSTSETAQY